MRIRRRIYELKTVFSGPRNVTCPCCGARLNQFLPYGLLSRPNALCPVCGCTERHRLLWLYFKSRPNLIHKDLNLLHITPQPYVRRVLKRKLKRLYVSVGMGTPAVDAVMDITAIALPDSLFDAVLCVAVMQYVSDDRAALREIYRVLKPGGWAVIWAPVDEKREISYENPAITSREDREREFGHPEHTRIYGRDFPERLRSAGFAVVVDRFAQELGAEAAKKYGLNSGEIIYYCEKPTASG